jgi:EAL and modified HD-GYP domain-containing signal transduction protein
LYRRSAGSRTAEGASRDVATASVIETLYGLGFDTLTGGHPAFLNISRQLLIEGIPAVLPARRIVLELGVDIVADDDVIRACRELKASGYALAIDRFEPGERADALVPFASYLKVELEALREHPRTAASPDHHVHVVATGVETVADFQEAATNGGNLFQGFFLGKPVLKGARAVAAQHVSGVRLLHALHDPDLTIARLDDLVSHDPALCFLILRTVNSAAYALRTTVRSIREALVLLGRDTVRRWAALWALAGLGRHTHSELLTMTTVRARCCELLAASTGDDDAAADGFMVGLWSLLDAILEQPMPDLLAATPVAPSVKDALLGIDNQARRTLDCVIAYEHGNWDQCATLARSAGVDADVLPAAYAEGLRWSTEIKRGPAR